MVGDQNSKNFSVVPFSLNCLFTADFSILEYNNEKKKSPQVPDKENEPEKEEEVDETLRTED